MEFAEYPLLNTPSLALILLKSAISPDATVNDALARLRATLRAVGEEPPFDDETIRARLRIVAADLAAAGLLQRSSGDRIGITVRGRRAIIEHPAGFDTADLVDEAEMRRRRREQRRRAPASDPRSAQYEEGYDAYRDGTPITENPFRQDTVDHLAWEDGWCEARDDNDRDDAA